ncbi:UDP-N-acetylmuramoyl-L-alanyl-D-glutamate--2,6-diaminopimelate ligase [Micropruina sonneratiae]|uniref:UDP-N-acetylmuramoyl-L-alanyl-D-glutamate--2, 6-diaminopimelate ligase n=1 Tax=Micropruina sonneratiae TaxID=2986940 RepID=UPI002226E4D9|nr:UDP-N-acetylmuramoyl-L-alanyl-D-glutamate--2,6-diaminopimelate ligase [Micropruina sp. KQZ13P-5]MCW3157138.1 UDP-N-acetylmuramoyl-L-alanyl-D-glutamate--2,6-diaminopimelate ligase [Micropruina sp. KQZ13P-5]
MAEHTVRLSDLGAAEISVTGVALDSRQVRAGELYAALPGQHTHGARFAGQALARGAVAVLTDEEGRQLVPPGVPVIVVDDPRAALAWVAAAANGEPATSMRMFGVTGTAGKTSTVFLLDAALGALGETVGTLGTIGFRLGGRPIERDRSTITTPEAPDLQELLAQLRDAGATSVAMEVSSHALALRRVGGITFDVAGFTNLGRDHLDFHHDLEDYFAAKSELFLDGRSRACVVNVDGEWGGRLAGLIGAEGTPLLTVGTVGDAAADFRLLASTSRASGSEVRAATPVGELSFTVGLPGSFNAANALLAAAMVHAAGLDVERAVTGFATAAVPGRMQPVALGKGAPHAVVDFAHTPESVAAALAALPQPRIAVLGAGGDRDPSKRGPMGAAAAANAEVVVVTDDNPRSEPPAAIRAAVLEGARAQGSAEVLDGGDRRSAIGLALGRAGADTWVAVLGKGHETGQDVGGVISPFEDVQVIAEEWRRLRGLDPGGSATGA